MAAESKRGGKDDPKRLFDQLGAAVPTSGFQLDLDAVVALIDRIHAVEMDEKEKLRQKDQQLVNLIARLQGVIRNAAWMPQGTAFAFRIVIAALHQIEAILWELKGEEGPIPKPQRPPGSGGGSPGSGGGGSPNPGGGGPRP